MNDWERRWREGQLGFHQDRPSWALEKHGPATFTDPTARILVPLAGKSLDMLWLEARGHSVVGIEMVELAVRSFFSEHGRSPSVEALTDSPGERYQAGSITLLRADVFDVEPHHLGGPVPAAFDRAALIALPEAERRRYAQRLDTLLEPGAHLLLVALEYEDGAMNGPPYRVPESEISSLFSGKGRLEKIDERDALDESPRFRERGLSWLVESVYRFSKDG